MKCKNCGSYLADDDESCPKCGTKVTDADRFNAAINALNAVTDAQIAAWDKSFTAEERKSLAKKGQARPDGSYPIRNVADLKNAIHAWGRGGATASDKAWIIKRAKALGATSELPEDWGGAKDADPFIGDEAMVKVKLDGVPVVLADAQQAAILTSFLTKLAKGKRVRMKDGDGDGAYDYTADDPDDDADEEMENEKKERGYKDAISARDGEIKALQQRLTDAAVTDAQLDTMITERMTVIDAARPLLAKDFVFSGRKLADIRRAAVAAKLGDAAVKDMDDAQVVGAFKVFAAGATGSRTLANGMTDALRQGGHSNQVVGDAATAAYDEMVKRNSEAWKKPITTLRN